MKKISSIDDLEEFRDGEVTILFERKFQVWTTLLTKKIVSYCWVSHIQHSLVLKTLYVSIKSILIHRSFNVVKLSLFNLSSYTTLSKPVGILVASLYSLNFVNVYLKMRIPRLHSIFRMIEIQFQIGFQMKNFSLKVCTVNKHWEYQGLYLRPMETFFLVNF